MIAEKLAQAMNTQIKNELESYYIYLSMAAWFHGQSLDGMAKWMRAQAHEEMIHAMKFFDHIIDRGGKVELQNLKQIKTEWSSVAEVWQDAYAHEQFISSKINELTTIAREAKDYPAEPLLAWFCDEQIEEEANSGKIATEIKRIGSDQTAILMMDRELGSRAFPVGSPLDQAAYAQA
jgi:ferritin